MRWGIRFATLLTIVGTYFLGPFVTYGALAIWAISVTYRDDDLRWLGAWLVIGWIVSNGLYYLHATPLQRTGPYSAIEIMVAVAAFCCLTHFPRTAIAVLCCNLVSVAANIGLAGYFSPSKQQIFVWAVTTNLCFACECLLTIGAGGGFRVVARFWRGLSGHRPAVALGIVARKIDP